MKLNPQELSYYNSSRSESAHGMACWSPVKNLFVGMRGKIMTCCYNKSYVLGDYPGENLKDIWFGEKRNNLISKLKENDFSHGCQGCLEGIKAGNINGLTSRKFDHLPLNAKGYPTRMDFELSNECNLECVMCRGEF
ncbi:MAG: SPASM domain-containing protein [Crocinitomix sp.]|nr:SPASM domain-containing protein [Crocinitomix sp.]